MGLTSLLGECDSDIGSSIRTEGSKRTVFEKATVTSEPDIPSPRKSWLPKHWLADLNMVLVAVFWGVNMPIMKFALNRVDEYLFNALRLALSTIVLGLICWQQNSRIFNREPGAKPLSNQLGAILVFSFFTGFAYQVLFLWGINATSAGNTALIMSGVPLWIAVLAFLLLGERLAGMAWIGLLVTLAGTIVVTLSKNGFGGSTQSVQGNLLVSAAAFSWALGSIWSRPMMKNISPIALAFTGIALSLPLHFFVARHAYSEISAIGSDLWLVGAVIYSGVFSTGFAYAMWNFGIKILGASHAAGFQNLVPLVAILASFFIGEVPYPLQLIGGALIIGGLIIMRRQRAKANQV